MAYGLHYTITFTNRRQNDVYRIEILEKDFVGEGIFLTGADNAFSAVYSGADDNPLNPIQGLEMTINFITDGSVKLLDFYTEDEEKYRVDYYCQSLADSTSVEQLLHTGFLVQLDAQEPLTDRKHVITLKASDNLGVLKSITLDVAFPFVYGQKSYWEIISYCLKATGLYSHDTNIDLSLHLRTFDNLFETTTDNRDDDDTNDPLRETFVHTGMFQNSDGTWMNCYDVLTKLLKSKNAQILQAEGFWNVRRLPEYRYFTDGAILGSDYNFNGSSTDITAITLSPLVSIDRSENSPAFYPIIEDQLSSIQRPYKFVKNTFNYQQSENIIQHDLQIAEGATPFDTNTIAGFRYDDYDLATYFPGWGEDGGSYCYLEIVTDTNVLPEAEVDRYIVSPSAHAVSGIQFNYMAVSAGDIIDFSFRFRTDADVSGDLRIYSRISVVTPSTTYGVVAAVGTLENPHWAPGSTINYLAPDTSGDTTQWMACDISMSTNLTGQLITIPADGFLVIEIYGTNGDASHDDYGVYWKDLNLTVYSFINSSLQITGQTHTDTQTASPKNNYDEEIYLDDSPRNSISGTLFTDEVTIFPFGNRFFTRTTLWQRAAIDEEKRLGNVITEEILASHIVARTVFEGTFANVRYFDYDDVRFVSMLNLFTADFVPDYDGKKFVLSQLTIDYMNDQFTGKFIELFSEGEDNIVIDYILDANETNGSYSGIGEDTDIHFNNVVTNTDFTVNGSFTEFTYTGIDAVRYFDVSLEGYWDGSASATVNLNVNGVSIGSYLVGVGGPFHFFRASIEASSPLTSGDVITVTFDWSGSITWSLDLLDNAIRIFRETLDNAGDYVFKYLYEQT